MTAGRFVMAEYKKLIYLGKEIIRKKINADPKNIVSPILSWYDVTINVVKMEVNAKSKRVANVRDFLEK